MNKLLLIGGLGDGLRRPVPSNSVPYFKIYHSSPALANAYLNDIEISMSTSTYKIVRLCRGDGTDVCVGVSIDEKKDVLDCLIKGYHGHRNPRRK